MRLNKRILTVLIMLFMTAVGAYVLPNHRIQRSQYIDHLAIPLEIKTWQGENIASLVDTSDDRFRFVNDIFARYYVNQKEDNILFLILDAENFHHPKTCFTSSGFSVRDLPTEKLSMNGHQIEARTFYAWDKKQSFLILYWMMVNGKQTDWREQKWTQLWRSILNQNDTALMVRLDVPVRKSTQDALKKAQQFLNDVSEVSPPDQMAFVLGK
jgi:EpsI family protein